MESDHAGQPVRGRDGANGWAGASSRAIPAQLLAPRPARRALLLVAAALYLGAPAPLAPGSPHVVAAQSAPSIIINPMQGPAGTTVQISADDFPGTDYQHTETYLFDSTPIGATPAFVLCDSQPAGAQTNFGFGTSCQSAATPVTLTIPGSASPGPHTIGVSDQAGLIASTTFTMTVPQQSTATPTSTGNAPTATTTGLPVATPTSPPNSTATPTAGPASPTATPTATATPTPKPAFPLVVLAYPLHLFSGGTLALSLRATPGARITVTLEFTASSNSGHGHGAIHAGAALYKHQVHGKANGAGLFWLTLHIPYVPRVRARATLIVAAREGATTFTARRRFG